MKCEPYEGVPFQLWLRFDHRHFPRSSVQDLRGNNATRVHADACRSTPFQECVKGQEEISLATACGFCGDVPLSRL